MSNTYKIIIFYCLLNLLLVNISIFSNAEIPMGSNKFDSIRLEYSLSGKYQTGKETFIQKQNKTSREVYLETNILSKKFMEHTLEIDDGVNFYRINLINKTGMKLPSLNSLKKQMVANNPQIFKSGRKNPLSIAPPKGLTDKKETILDKDCKVYFYNNKWTYIWEDIILQEIQDAMDKFIKKAEKLEVNITIDDSSFQIPKEIKFQGKAEL